MSDAKNGWAGNVPVSPVKISESEKAQREEAIAKYAATLKDLQSKIAAANTELESIKKDIDKIHAARNDAYRATEQRLKAMQNDLQMQQNSIDQQRIELANKIKSHEEHNSLECQKLKDKETSLLAKEDQLHATKKELDEYAMEQIKTAEKQAAIQVEHLQRKADLEAATTDLNAAIEKAVKEHHELKELWLIHQKNVDAHLEAQKELERQQQKNMDFYNALVAREADLEPLKKKYEDGIEVNVVEAKRLQDQNIESYAIQREAQKRIEIAVKSETRANEAIAKLEDLKKDLHAQIKQEA
jgi:hypothetical protein